MLFGAIEAGGTKFVCGIGDETGTIIERVQFETKSPDETMPKVIDFFKDKNIAAIGLGCFGPIDVNKESETYGSITSTPKLKWQNYPILDELRKHFNIPMGFDTDVNGAALGESMYGAAAGLDNVLYITIGTGIGAGALVEGKLVHGMLHPEMGHINVRRHPEDSFKGTCPFHNDCLEGLAAGPAIEQRYNKKGQELTDSKEVWDLEAYYIAQALVNYILILSPQKIIIGGGVSKQAYMMEQVRKNVTEMLNGYIKTTELKTINEYIINPGLKDDAGLCGAIALAVKAL
ncbi:ROK family protein [Haloplasma contractile]|uniref:fructokinase n=1 Tax=Haloplasma contractile SSD-17B TaxID=1033810 RepID=U2EFD0_9MOLU|nr:ROK family protein [Haloplasma contractile]ERJ13643.1 Putative fructokinase protein [Haloplasma contractile SSD-17B]